VWLTVAGVVTGGGLFCVVVGAVFPIDQFPYYVNADVPQHVRLAAARLVYADIRPDIIAVAARPIASRDLYAPLIGCSAGVYHGGFDSLRKLCSCHCSSPSILLSFMDTIKATTLVSL